MALQQRKDFTSKLMRPSHNPATQEMYSQARKFKVSNLKVDLFQPRTQGVWAEQIQGIPATTLLSRFEQRHKTLRKKSKKIAP
jgi:hypothetical protein